MIGCYHRLHGHGFEWTPRVGDGQGGLACCDSWGCKELDKTEWLSLHFHTVKSLINEEVLILHFKILITFAK